MVVIAFSRTLVMTAHLSLGHSAICWQLESWAFPQKNPTCNKSQDIATVIGVTNGSFFRAKDNKAVTLLFTNTRKCADQMFGVLNHLSELWCFGDVRLHNSIYQRDIELHAAIFCLSSGSEVELDRRTAGSAGLWVIARPIRIPWSSLRSPSGRALWLIGT